MPELPEVETIARQLRDRVIGQVISRVWVDESRVVRFPGGQAMGDRILGQRIEEVIRRGKYLGLRLGSGEFLGIHLGMTGHLRITHKSTPDPTHLHLRLGLGNEEELRLDDSRMFGRIGLGTWEELIDHGVVAKLGLEPLDEGFTLQYFDKALKKTKAPLKVALLDQKRIAGMGNIYVDESCFRAGLYPGVVANSLSEEETGKLFRAIREVLTEAILRGGSSIDDYVDAQGNRGTMQDHLVVYGREGEFCGTCEAEIIKTIVGGRGTHYCPSCQSITRGVKGVGQD